MLKDTILAQANDCQISLGSCGAKILPQMEAMFQLKVLLLVFIKILFNPGSTRGKS